MNVDIHFDRDLGSDALEGHARVEIDKNLSRFARALKAVRLRLFDRNGRRGGPDKGCRVVIASSAVTEFCVEEYSADAYQAIDQATEKARRQLVKLMQRADSKRRRKRTGAFEQIELSP